MANQELVNYIKQEKEKGKNIEEIEKELLGAGWQRAVLKEAFGLLGFNQSAGIPQPSPSSFSAKVEEQKLHPKAVWMFFFRFLGLFLFLVFILSFGLVGIFTTLSNSGIFFPIFLFLLLSILWIGFSYFWARLSYKAYKYSLTEDGFKKELGVIWKKYVTIPYERIQNVDIHRGIIARMLGLSDIKIHTAGYSGYGGGRGFAGGESEGALPGVSQEVAEQLREELIRRAKGGKSGV